MMLLFNSQNAKKVRSLQKVLYGNLKEASFLLMGFEDPKI